MKKNVLFLLIPIFVIFICYFIYYKEDHMIFPSPGTTMIFYSDSNFFAEGKTSPPVYNLSDSEMKMRYTLKKGYRYPYAGVEFAIDSVLSQLDISSYNVLNIDLKAPQSKSLKFVLHLTYKGSNRPGTTYPFRILEQEVAMNGENFELKLENFRTPAWWYRKNHVTAEEAGPINYKEAISFLIQSGEHAPIEKEEIIILKSVVLSQNTTFFWVTASLASLIYYVLIYFLLRKKKSKEKYIPYQKLEISKNSEEEKLFSYLASNYHDADLSIEKLNQELGIPITKIPVLIKNKTRLPFKQYLNTIRIQEAKRLLSETDEQIVQISLAVGYNTVTHFNKVFRQMENVSPKEFRMKEKILEEKKAL